jgi:type I restriction enzyme S subunit
VVPLLSTREFRGEGGWDTGSAPLVPVAVFDEQNERIAFAPSDIVMARKGRLGLFRHPPAKRPYTFSHTIFVIKPDAFVDPDYLLVALRRPEVVGWLEQEMNSNTGVPTLGKSYTEKLPIPIAPGDEQRVISQRVAVLLQRVEALRAPVAAASDRMERIERGALAKAFRGELVPQDPSDEPAAVLLERIRAARAAEPDAPRRGRVARTPTTSSATATPINGHAATNHDDSLDLVIAAFHQGQPRLTAAAITDTTGLPAGAVKQALKELVDAGQVKVAGKGRGAAYVWAP